MFVTFDTTYSEATLNPELISRWISPDPQADKRYSYSPYNFSRNNPIIFTDPDGQLDDYYGIVNNNLVYLGNDGQGNNVRLVTEDQHSEVAPLLNGANTTQDQRDAARSSDMSTVVTFDESAVQSQVQGVNDRTITSGNENSTLITLDPSTATVSAQQGATGDAKSVTNTVKTFGEGSGSWTMDGSKLIVGVAHGHPEQTDGTTTVSGFSKGDAQTAKGGVTYSIDSFNSSVGGAATIHQAVGGDKSGTNPVGTTQNTNGLGKSSFLQSAKRQP
jgi:hypothetical protein